MTVEIGVRFGVGARDVARVGEMQGEGQDK